MSRNSCSSPESLLPAGALPFREIWALDTEFRALPGERPEVVCLTALELYSGKEIRLWVDELRAEPPYPVGPDVLIVGFFLSAEFGVHLAMDWPLPCRALDLFAEHRNFSNGRPTLAGNSLVGALATFGLEAMSAGEKSDLRALIMRGGPWNADEREAILTYCLEDARAVARLLPAMLPYLLGHPKRLGQALWRAKYMGAVATMERRGVPIDTATWRRLTTHWEAIKGRLVDAIDKDYGVYPGGRFSAARFAEYLAEHRIPWPRLESGALALTDDVFKERAKAYPQIGPLRELRFSLSQLRLSDLAVGKDGRNRCLLSPFRAKTGRNAPSTSKFVFAPATWLRSLIQPPPGHALVYADYAGQELAVAAALSRDEALMSAYQTGDPYLHFAQQAGLAPPDATKASHGAVRDRCKTLSLALNYGMSAAGLAQRLGLPEVFARELVDAHRRTYPRFWAWNQAAVDYGMLRGRLHTMFGWTLHVGPDANPRSLMNFPVQGGAAEMLRVAACFASEAGLELCAPVHDAFLALSPVDRLDADVAKLRECMARASRDVLDGFGVRVDVKLIRWPDRYVDPRGAVMWRRITEVLERIETAAA